MNESAFIIHAPILTARWGLFVVHGHWAEASVERVMDAGIMGGRTTGFAPNEQITRAEMAVVVERMLKQLGK
ncbi:S-layer homology domain-containing protein [Paenibacillus popilliae]|uniref:SLH domain-containing protein n=1 Tax=Paenibacillus popilliae ATCC 14706 TaxID=1212764 RepID=M9LHG5_PAEPP|nr:S-layer homology domain-containing protein [Paenibacillus popilliae]GAC42235.1 hypothetical protein PPOP_1592 [Paenibacillus popilliae ATCC 14706]